MSYLEFDKGQLINLEYSLSRETLRTNRAGSFSSSTIISCNTRKYHGLLISPIDGLGGENHVLLSSLDETIIQHERHFHLAVHKYPGVVHPGHKYVREFEAEPIPTIVYRVGGVLLKKEMLLVEKEEKVLVKYTLMECHSATKMWLHPFLAFRNVHFLTKANMDVNQKFEKVENGISVKMYDSFPDLYMQTSKKSDYVSAPDWFFNVEYMEESKRGYESQEDLYVPGFFEINLKKGESIIFSAGLDPSNPKNLQKQFAAELKKRTPRDSYENCLENSAQQFIISKNGKTEIIAGFPWFDKWSRDTFIALPGLAVYRKDYAAFEKIVDTMLENCYQEGLFTVTCKKGSTEYSGVDTPLWFVWALQQYAYKTRKFTPVWKKYGEIIKEILLTFRKGTRYNIRVLDNGLVHAGYDSLALTWMNTIVEGRPVTPRNGVAVEVNALWYNAIKFALELAKKAKDKDFIGEWKSLPEMIEKSFEETFWDNEKGYLADYVNGTTKNWDVRPNQIFAASLPYSPVNEDIRHAVVTVVHKELYTPKGLRTLSPKNNEYKGVCTGDANARDIAFHNGTAWPWLLGPFAEAYVKLHGKAAAGLLNSIYNSFEEDMFRHGIGSISQIFDGDPPYFPGGAISHACSIAEILRVKALVEEIE